MQKHKHKKKRVLFREIFSRNEASCFFSSCPRVLCAGMLNYCVLFILRLLFLDLVVCLFGWFPNILVNNKALSRTGPKTDVSHFYELPHTSQSRETMTSVSAGHLILRPTQPVGIGRLFLELSFQQTQYSALNEYHGC